MEKRRGKEEGGEGTWFCRRCVSVGGRKKGGIGVGGWSENAGCNGRRLTARRSVAKERGVGRGSEVDGAGGRRKRRDGTEGRGDANRAISDGKERCVETETAGGETRKTRFVAVSAEKELGNESWKLGGEHDTPVATAVASNYNNCVIQRPSGHVRFHWCFCHVEWPARVSRTQSSSPTLPPPRIPSHHPK